MQNQEDNIQEAIMSSGIPQRLKDLIVELEGKMIEREEMIRLILLCIFAKNHAFLIGEAGVGKTYATQLISKSISDGVFWEKMISKETKNIDVLGDEGRTIDIKDTIAGGDFVFLDEMFKGEDTLLNALLGVMNERRIHIKGEAVPIPLSTMFSASNELPTGEKIQPFVDRLLLWYEVKKISKLENQIRFNRGEFDKSQEIKNSFKKEHIEFVSNLTKKMNMSDEFSMLLTQIKNGMSRIGLKCSDRKFGPNFVIKALLTSAVLNGRSDVNYSDFILIKHFGWSSLQDRRTLLVLLNNILYGDKAEIKARLLELQKILKKTSSTFEADFFLFLRNKEEILNNSVFEEKIEKCNLFLKTLLGLKKTFQDFRNMEQKNERINKEVEENIFVMETLNNPFDDKEVSELMDNIESIISLDENRTTNFLKNNSSFLDYQNNKLQMEG